MNDTQGQEIVHAHDVLHLMVGACRPLPRMHLLLSMEAYFGHEARYVTCQDPDGLTAEELIAVLEDRSKIVMTEGGYIPNFGQSCDHDHDHDHEGGCDHHHGHCQH